ncbi:hypothetical protein TNCV_418401 [Trichonephila clavipes]|nr:hypothetical protein TNCV_418401 [Trichonephila clavipes]
MLVRMVDSSRFQRHNGSSLPRNTADREDRFILRSLSQRLIHLINHQTCNPHKCPHDHLQTGWMERNLYSRTSRYAPTTHACTLSSQITVVLGSDQVGIILTEDV